MNLSTAKKKTKQNKQTKKNLMDMENRLVVAEGKGVWG